MPLHVSRASMAKFIRFAIVGGSGTLVGLGVLYLFTSIIGLHYLWSNCISFICAVSSNFTLNSLWTFKKNSGIKGYFSYITVSLIGLGLSTVLMYLFTTKLGIFYMLSSILTIMCIFPINFLLSRRLVWRN